MNCYHLDSLPVTEDCIVHTQGVHTPAEERQPDKVYWSGYFLPKIGDRVWVNFNDLNNGLVIAYFVEFGFLGVEVQPDVRPEWHIRQNPNRNYCMAFGKEIQLEHK